MSNQLIKRKDYLDKIINCKDNELIKVITGVRRSGKSSLLKLIEEYLLEIQVNPENIIYMNFESMKYDSMSYKDLYKYIENKIKNKDRYYLLFDELQKIDGWENAINSFKVDFNTDIYITGSNGYLLSSEYSTYLSGRYIEIKVYPLSFKEFIKFNGYRKKEIKIKNSIIKAILENKDGNNIEIEDLFNLYIKYGGLPQIINTEFDEEKINLLLDGIYSSVLIKDILLRKENNINDRELLRKVILVLADNIGNTTSLNKIANTLKSNNLTDRRSPAIQTISSYIQALKEAYLFYEVNRYDIRGKEYLKSLTKIYIVDIGIRNYLLGVRDIGNILENIIYFELLRRGYKVAVGKVDDLEIDFIAEKQNKRKYIQVTKSIENEITKTREIKALQKIKDNYPKIILTLDKVMEDNIEGIEIKNIIDFLME